MFAAAIQAPVINIAVSRSHSFVPGQRNDEEVEEERVTTDLVAENAVGQEQSERGMSSAPHESFVASPPSIADTSFKKVNKRIRIELHKGRF